jgi:transposase-like protein
MKKTRDGRRRFTREFKIAAVQRITEGEPVGEVARDLGIKFQVLWRWKKKVIEKGEAYLYEVGRPQQWQRAETKSSSEAANQRRIAELERLVGRQQLEIRFLDGALRRVKGQRQPKSGTGEKASSKE